MHIARVDPSGTSPQKDRELLYRSIKTAVLAAVFLWLLTLADQLLSLHLHHLGLYPRKLSGLSGLIFAPLIHSGWSHLLSNTLPLLVGLSSMLYAYPQSSRRALPIIYIGGSALAWLFARPSYHIGASGFIFGVLAFLFVSGMLRRDMRSMAVSMMIWFLYASMIWGILPIREGTSWEMHLAGAVVGVIMAFSCRSLDPVKVKKYSWEEEGADAEEVPEWYTQAMQAKTQENEQIENQPKEKMWRDQ